MRAVSEILVRAKNSKGTGSVPRITVTRSQIYDLVNLLEMFEEATNCLQSNGVTASVVIPAILGIDNMLADSNTQFNTFRLQLRSSLQRRFQNIVTRREYVTATVLDPRYKLTPFNETCSGQSADLTPITTVSAVEARQFLLEQLRTVQSSSRKMTSGSNQTDFNDQLKSSVKKSSKMLVVIVENSFIHVLYFKNLWGFGFDLDLSKMDLDFGKWIWIWI